MCDKQLDGWSQHFGCVYLKTWLFMQVITCRLWEWVRLFFSALWCIWIIAVFFGSVFSSYLLTYLRSFTKCRTKIKKIKRHIWGAIVVFHLLFTVNYLYNNIAHFVSGNQILGHKVDRCYRVLCQSVWKSTKKHANNRHWLIYGSLWVS